MRNVRLIIAYDGTDFHGWQRQPDEPTVQGCLEEALAGLTGDAISVCGSGRTDAGVHAQHQVANFHTASTIPCANIVKALNDLLPPTVQVKQAEDVAANFHARYHVRRKTYRYRIVTAPICSPLVWRYVCHHPYPLDRERISAAARLLEGEHDFTSFAAVGENEEGEGESGVRRIFHSRILWRPRSSMLIYEVMGNGFLRYMVRNIVGTLLEVGGGKRMSEDIRDILSARDRSRAGPTAPAQGLCLANVEYAAAVADTRGKAG